MSYLLFLDECKENSTILINLEPMDVTTVSILILFVTKKLELFIQIVHEVLTIVYVRFSAKCVDRSLRK